MRKNKAYYAYLAIFVGILFLLSLIRNVSKIGEARKRIDKASEKVEKLREENEEIKRRLAEVKGEEYIEKQLRDKLGLAKEGEIVVVLPDEETLRKIAPSIPEEEEVLDAKTVWKERWMMGLRLAEGVLLNGEERDWDRLFSDWEPQGWAQRQNGRLRLTDKGFLLTNRLTQNVFEFIDRLC